MEGKEERGSREESRGQGVKARKGEKEDKKGTQGRKEIQMRKWEPVEENRDQQERKYRKEGRVKKKEFG